jgi:D-beta-D-heptose 7-phosphate kinase/D-beta-D-heptose 1-phosphate adenosyltransferase
VTELLDTTVAAVNSALERARATMAALPCPSTIWACRLPWSTRPVGRPALGSPAASGVSAPSRESAGRCHDGLVNTLGAPVVTFDEFQEDRPTGRIVVTSGGYDPVHPGHISSIQASHRYGDVVVVVVNGDAFLTAKKGRPFQDLETRCLVVSAIRGVDYVVPFEVEGDQTVREALRRLRPHVFTKGGDRLDVRSIPEWDVCQELGIEVVTGVGEDKRWSSSWFLSAWSSSLAGSVSPLAASDPPPGHPRP